MASSIGKIMALAALVAVVAAKSPCACPKNYRPVCGSDGTTYGNPCTFRCAQSTHSSLTIRHDGQCQGNRPRRDTQCDCPRVLDLVCGTDGVTYGHSCFLNCTAKEGLEVAYKGPCVEQVKPVCACTKDRRPVCGSDEITYRNPCTFRCAQSSQPSLTLSHDGECVDRKRPVRSVVQSLCPCTKELHYVCGSDGETYSNPCLLRCAAKRKPGLKLEREGRCRS